MRNELHMVPFLVQFGQMVVNGVSFSKLFLLEQKQTDHANLLFYALTRGDTSTSSFALSCAESDCKLLLIDHAARTASNALPTSARKAPELSAAKGWPVSCKT